MSLWDQLDSLADRAIDLVGNIETEEATKTALVMPFLQTLGYDVFNPSEVIPEFTADVGIKRGEKVDYAICRDGEPTILIECKPHGAPLDNYSGQLFRYFSVTKARIAILTDGLVYRVYSDLAAPNKLDDSPFLTVSLAALKREAVAQLEKIAKHSFDLDTVLQSAEALRYQNQLIARFAAEIDAPSEGFVKVLADPVYDGRFTAATMEKFRGLVRSSIRTYISDAVDRRLRSALEQNAQSESEAKAEGQSPAEEPEIVTTAEELQGLYIVRAILGDIIPSARIAPRDVRSYFGILLDDNNRKPICRLWFNGSKKYLGVFDASKRETRIEVGGPDDLFQHASKIRESLAHVMD